MPACLVGLGSNAGDRAHLLRQAVDRLGGQESVRVIAVSRWHETPPVGGPPGQGPFLNGAALLETSLSPEALLDALLEIERALGRTRAARWSARTIDLDLLLYDRRTLRTQFLTLPHPRMAWRRFVLEPAVEIAPTMVHPPTGWTIARLLEHLDTAAHYVAVTGPIGAGKTHLAERIVEKTAGLLMLDPVDWKLLGPFSSDPGGNGRRAAIEFLQRRAELLAASRDVWLPGGALVVSDFWFGQSAALARVLLPEEQRKAFRRRLATAGREIVRPMLIVLLDVPAGLGPRGEEKLSVDVIDRLDQATIELAGAPGHGPVLHLTGGDAPDALEEVLAAVEAMA